jgi:tetratricopeptide (TPR) repeat protein
LRSIDRGRALFAAAELLMVVSGEPEQAATLAREALDIARRAGDQYLRAEVLCLLAHTARYAANEAAVQAHAEEGLRVARSIGDPHLVARLLLAWGTAPSLSLADRVRAFEEGFELFRQAGDRTRCGRCLANQAYWELNGGQIAAARTHMAAAVAVAKEMRDQWGECGYGLNLGLAAHLDGDDAEAKAIFRECLRVAEQIGVPVWAAYAQLGLALVASRAGDPRAAATLHGAADAINERLGTRFESLEAGLREADIAGLRDTLGEPAYHMAYEEGHSAEAAQEPLLT